MISVFRGSNYLEGQLLLGLLQQHHIKAFLQGAALQGGLGEVPAVGYLSILVEEEDRLATERLIAAYERGELAIADDDPEANAAADAATETD
jgi:hypothetical protein